MVSARHGAGPSRDGAGLLQHFKFVAGLRQYQPCGRLLAGEVVRRLVTASGALGGAADYPFPTYAAFGPRRPSSRSGAARRQCPGRTAKDLKWPPTSFEYLER